MPFYISKKSSFRCFYHKLLGNLDLTEVTENNTNTFKWKTKKALASKFTGYWHKTVISDSGRLRFYKSVKNKLEFEPYLNLPAFEQRKCITKLRCSNHSLQVEEGRHHNILPENRMCRICPLKEVETEEHFLIRCTFFYRYKPKFNLQTITSAKSFMLETEPDILGSYLSEAFCERKRYQEWFCLE